MIPCLWVYKGFCGLFMKEANCEECRNPQQIDPRLYYLYCPQCGKQEILGEMTHDKGIARRWSSRGLIVSPDFMRKKMTCRECGYKAEQDYPGYLIEWIEV